MESVRLDKWLWAARFFKTRSIAKDAITGGKIKLNGVTLKPSLELKTGEVLTIRRGHDVYDVEVIALSDKRGNATVAQNLYCETQSSLERRERAQLARQVAPKFEAKPDKKQRRQIREMKTSD